jgi:choline dehydrogenase-like flavoprotein
MERRTIARMGQIIADEFQRIGLPKPDLCNWAREGRLSEAVLIDAAHPTGATRMSADPRSGVVDPNCQVHGLEGLYVAGSSVFPTSGHANPTLMILALAHRLAKTLKNKLAKPASLKVVAAPRHYSDQENVALTRKTPANLSADQGR